MSFLTYDTADDIITSLEIIEKLLFPETDFCRNNYLKVRELRHGAHLRLIKSGRSSLPLFALTLSFDSGKTLEKIKVEMLGLGSIFLFESIT